MERRSLSGCDARSEAMGRAPLARALIAALSGRLRTRHRGEQRGPTTQLRFVEPSD